MPARPSRDAGARVSRHTRSLIGWQGITVRVPEDWHIGAISGEDADGYIRVQDDDMVRLEIKWEQAGKFVEMEGIVEKYLSDLEKRSRRTQPPMKTRHGSRTKGPDELGRRSIVRFAWSADRQGQGMAWLCETCNRVVIAQVLAPLSEDLRTLSREVLGTFRDHAEGGWRTWASYGFAADVPEHFKLAGQRLMTGLLEFSFEQDTEKITVSRRALADVALRGKTLLEWARKDLASGLRDFAVDTDMLPLHGHDALTISGRKSKLAPQIQRFAWHILRRKYGDRAEWLVWECPETNKILTVETTVDVENTGIAREIAQRIRCH